MSGGPPGPGSCPRHDLPLGRDAMCDECRWQQAAHEDDERDTRHLWAQR